MNCEIQKGFKFFGGPLNGDFLELGDDFGDSFELEQYEYHDLEEEPFSRSLVHCYVKRFYRRERKYAYFYAGDQPTHH